MGKNTCYASLEARVQISEPISKVFVVVVVFKAGSRAHTPITSVVLGTETGGLLEFLQV